MDEIHSWTVQQSSAVQDRAALQCREEWSRAKYVPFMYMTSLLLSLHLTSMHLLSELKPVSSNLFTVSLRSCTPSRWSMAEWNGISYWRWGGSREVSHNWSKLHCTVLHCTYMWRKKQCSLCRLTSDLSTGEPRIVAECRWVEELIQASESRSLNDIAIVTRLPHYVRILNPWERWLQDQWGY